MLRYALTVAIMLCVMGGFVILMYGIKDTMTNGVSHNTFTLGLALAAVFEIYKLVDMINEDQRRKNHEIFEG